MRRLLVIVVGIGSATSTFAEEPAPISPAPIASAAPDVNARIDDLARQLGEAQARLDRQGAELRQLRTELDAQKDAHAGFRIGRLAVSLFGYVQADGVVYSSASVNEVDPSTRAPLNETRFLIRRARLRADVDYGYVAGALEFDGNTVSGPVARILDAEVSACWPRCSPWDEKPPLVMATLGLMRIPFGFEVQEKDYVRLFLERSNAERAFFPGEFDLGARVQGGWRWLRWQVAAMNGHPSGEKQFALVDPTASKDFLGRVGAETQPHRRVAISGGVSGLWGTGFSTGTPSTKATLIWRDTNADGQVDITEIFGSPGESATPSRTFTRYALGGDLRVVIDLPRVGALAVYGELTWATNLDRALYIADPIANGGDLRELGWYLAATQQLTRWAAFGIRYDRYDPDADARQQVGSSIVPRDKTFTTLSLVGAVMWQKYARFSFEWDHSTNALGISDAGAPATLGGDVFTIRGQVAF